MTNAETTRVVDDSVDLDDDFVQLARLALTGRDQDVEVYLRRLAKRYRRARPEVASELVSLLRRAPTRSSPLRESSVATTPVDLDSREALVRTEWPGSLPITPIYDNDLQRQLLQLVAERANAEKLLINGLSPSRTALFTGPPGVGKTLAARWIASELELPLLLLDLSSVMSSLLGRTGGNLKRVLQYAKEQPCILLLDEFDAIAKKRDDNGEIGELKRLVAVLLQEIDDWPSTSLIIAATNHSELLDPAAWRRFEVVAEFQLPSSDAISSSVAALLHDEPGLEEEIQVVASVAYRGLSFSDIEREVKSARRRAVLTSTPLKDVLLSSLTSRIAGISFAKRKDLAVELVHRGVLTQRRASDLLKISRDTIRKAKTDVLSRTVNTEQAEEN